jgi:hypothetical protein
MNLSKRAVFVTCLAMAMVIPVASVAAAERERETEVYAGDDGDRPGPRASRPVLTTVAAGYLPTSLCGELGPTGDCFAGVAIDVNFRLWDPRAATLYFDVGTVAFTDRFERGGAAALGLRLRFDKWGVFVPYLVTTLDVGYGAYPTGGGSFRVWNRSGIGAELSIRSVAGHGVGLFAEVAGGRGCCTTTYGIGGEVYQTPYNQYQLMVGMSF